MSTSPRPKAALLAFFATLALALPGCGDKHADIPAAEASAATAPLADQARSVDFQTDPDDKGLRIELSDATPAGGADERLPAPPTSPLSAAEVQALLSRLPALPEEAADQADFARRAESRPAPRPGSEVTLPFPVPQPDLATPDTPTGPLQVLRAAPEGDVPLAPHLSLTFDQPMIAIQTQDQAAQIQPVQLSPQPEGQWRWLGTRTVIFEPTLRFPMATTYTVTVPAGTASASGQALAAPFTRTFRTPPPRLVSQVPQGTSDRQPVIVVGFDQRVDPEAVQGKLVVTAGGAVQATRLATPSEVQADPAAREAVRQLDSAGPGRWLAVLPRAPLPADAPVEVRVPTGTPSAEGPRTTEADQRWSFRTYGPLKLVESTCGWRERCLPDDAIQLRFSNAIDPDAFETELVTVSPEIPEVQIYASGPWLTVQGAKEPLTTYTVTVAGELKDSFGQLLGAPVSVRKKTGKREPAEPALLAPGPELRVLDPAASPSYSVYTINHDTLRLRVLRVKPEDWAAWRTWRDHRAWWDRDVALPPPPGQSLADQTLTVASKPDELVETRIDLKPWLGTGPGQLVVWVEPRKQPDRWGRQVALSWVQRTDLGLAAYADHHDIVAWATDLATGAPAADVSVSLSPTGPTMQTGADGLARGSLGTGTKGPQVLVAQRGEDIAMLPVAGGYGDQAAWTAQPARDGLAWLVFDDRNLYKPGETVKVKGWLRRVGLDKGGDIGALGEAGPRSLTYTLNDARGSQLARGEVPVVGLGGFDLSLDLPDDANLGTAMLRLEAKTTDGIADTYVLPFEVQEFRRPEFEVTAEVEAGNFVLGQTAIATVNAAYYAGGGLPGAEVRWNVQPTWASYRPPHQEDYDFGVWVPWWNSPWWQPVQPDLKAPDPLSATTDASGAHHLGMHFAALGTPRPVQVEAEAVVTDVNRQAWAARTTVLVHPAEDYVGLHTPRPFVDAGKAVEIEAVVVDIEGHPVAGRKGELRLSTQKWGRDKTGRWTQTEDDVQTCPIESLGAAGQDPWEAKPVSCSFTPARGGQYTVKARITDAQGRPNESELSLWVSGAQGDRPRDRSVQQEQAILVPDQEHHAPGDVAEILVQSPFGPCEGLLTLRRSGLVDSRRFTMDSDSTVLRVPLSDAMVPGVEVQVDLVGSAPRTDDEGAERADLPRRPAYASGALSLDVQPLTRTLKVAITPAATSVDPGAHTSLDLAVTDDRGKPVADAELAVIVVDEAVLALTGYRLPDPLDVFYAARPSEVSEEQLRGMLWLDDPGRLGGMGGPGAKGRGTGAMDELTVGSAAPMMMAAEADGAMMPPPSPAEAEPPTTKRMAAKADKNRDGDDDDAGAVAGPAIALRSDMRALALFAPAERSGSDGHVRVALDLPDSLTRYRIMVVAVDGGRRFGSSDASITARKPLMLRPSAPRFLNFGDRAELPFVVQNQTDAPMTVALAVGASNARFVEDTFTAPATDGQALPRQAGLRFQVPANDRVEVRLPVTTQKAGTATFQAALSGRPVDSRRAAESTDATQLSLPVWTPATSEAFATYGEIGGLPPEGGPPGGDPSAILQPVASPGEVWPQYGGLEITTSSTAVQALTDALLYLVHYPYECAEQRASRVLSVAALKDVLTAFDAEGLPSPEAMKTSVDQDVEELSRLQNPDGGWSFWRKGDTSWPYVSLHVAHALARAQAKGFAVPDATRRRTLSYLRNIDGRIPADYPRSARQALRAYALYVRRIMDDGDPAAALKLYREAGIGDVDKDGLSIEALAWILPSLADGKHEAEVAEILRFFHNRVSETAATAQITSGYGEGDWLLLYSDRRADAVVLEALIDVAPRDDVIPKLVRGLLDHRVKGRWGSTQENAFVLLALDHYFGTYEAETPDFVARAWLGGTYAGDHAFHGRSTEYATIQVPMNTVQQATASGPAPLVLQRDGKGRLYYRVGLRYAPRSLDLAPADRGFVVLRSYEAVDDPADVRKEADGTWHIKAGSRVRVRLTMVADARRTHVALVDPIPAGLEAINPALAVSESVPADAQAAAKAPPWSRDGGYWWWWRPWYEHENMRDERVEAFASLVWAGVYDYSYVARATTPGAFVVPPTKAEEMYHPETFGRSGTDKVVVEP